MPETESLSIEVWSDLVCPWCWIGKRRLEKVLKDRGLQAQWRFRAYELGPRRQERKPVAEHLAEKYRLDAAEAAAMVERVATLGRELGLAMDPRRQFTAPTFDAHRLVQAAQREGKAGELVERLHRAHFGEGRDLGDKAALQALAEEAGLQPAEARRVLETQAWAAEVEADEARARELGAEGVPFFVFRGRLSLGGAQSEQVFGQALEQAMGMGGEAWTRAWD